MIDYNYLLISFAIMKNFFSYISSPAKKQKNDDEEKDEEQKKFIDIDYQKLHQLETALKELDQNMIRKMLGRQSLVASTFEDLMGTLHGLINVVEVIKIQLTDNQQKIKEYDRAKKLLASHDRMINDLQEQQSKTLNRFYQEKSQLIYSYQKQINELKNTNQALMENAENLQKQNQKLKLENKEVIEQVQYLKKKVQQIGNILTYEREIMKNLIQIRNNSIQVNHNLDREHVDLQKIFYYSKLRKRIYSFLTLKDSLNLSLTSKRIRYIFDRSFKRDYVPTMISVLQSKNLAKLQEIKEYQKIFDKFPPESIRVNALKYLFFKIKPGAYILPFIQQSEEVKVEQKPHLSWKNIFGIKEHPKQKEKGFSIHSLKQDKEFKEVQERIQIFFNKLFEINLPDDLKNYVNTMQQQLEDLKIELKTFDKSYQLLNMSKFLFLEVGELYNLLQVCFGLLVNTHQELIFSRKKQFDLSENNGALRNLVENMTNDRGQTQKRLWFLENQSIKLKTEMRQVEVSVNKFDKQNKGLKEKLQALELAHENIQNRYEQQKKEKNEIETDLKGISDILEETKKLKIDFGKQQT